MTILHPFILLLSTLIISYSSQASSEHLFSGFSECGDSLYAHGGYSYVGQGGQFFIKNQHDQSSFITIALSQPIIDILVLNDELYTLTANRLEKRHASTGQLEESFSIPNNPLARFHGMTHLGSYLYLAAGEAGILTFNTTTKTYEGFLKLPPLNENPRHRSAYVDVTSKDQHLIFLVDNLTVPMDPRLKGAFKGLVTYNTLSQQTFLFDQAVDPGFETVDVLDGKLLATSFFPAWTFAIEPLIKKNKVALIRRWVSLGNLQGTKSGKLFIDEEKGNIYSCLHLKIPRGERGQYKIVVMDKSLI